MKIPTARECIKNVGMLTVKSGLTHLGRYVQLMGRVLVKPDRWRMFYKQYVTEMFQLGYITLSRFMTGMALSRR